MEFVDGARLIAGGREMVERVYDMLEESGITVRGNPDVYVREYGHFGVDDARLLRARASSRALGESPRIFIIVAASMNTEAQNTLLKTLEEPPAGASFFFILPSPHTLLPTLRSRTQMLSFPNTKTQKELVDARTFMKAKPTERIEMLKVFLEKDENDQRDLHAITSFLASLESLEAEHLPRSAEGLKAIYRARKYIGDKGALMKPLLEHVALLVPERGA